MKARVKEALTSSRTIAVGAASRESGELDNGPRSGRDKT
jgi:hypothetical protein